MKKKALSSLLIFALALTTLTACGGGGGGGSSSAPPVQPTTAVLTLSTAVTGSIPASTVIAGYDVTITLPAGVTVKSTTPPQTDASVVVGTANGAAPGTYNTGSFSPATGKVHIVFVSPQGNGFNGPGEFCKVNCNIAAGYYPTAADFQQLTFKASGLNKNPQPTTVDLTGQLSMTVTAAIN
ncbi:MAG TPA: hypothetical protein VEM40_07165 [Nitrospirota bacterium]|nr:hypothetical protein [Nitrospirota bacterium]